MYAEQRKANIPGNGDIIQSSMIWGQLWDQVISFAGTDEANSTLDTLSTQSQVNQAGASMYLVTDGNNQTAIADVIKNIYDLRRNVYEWTAEANGTGGRSSRGGSYSSSKNANTRGDLSPGMNKADHGSRLIFYIK